MTRKNIKMDFSRRVTQLAQPWHIDEVRRIDALLMLAGAHVWINCVFFFAIQSVFDIDFSIFFETKTKAKIKNANCLDF